MTTAYWCVLICIFFPYFFTVLAKTGGRFDNFDPRAYLERTVGWRRRAHYVQLNSFEATPAFGLAVIIAELAQAPQLAIDKLAIVFIIARTLYAMCYLADKALSRTCFWMIGMCTIIGLFYLSMTATHL